MNEFTVEMKSKRYVKNISVSNEAHEFVIFEGTLGEHMELSLLEGDVLEIVGRNGVLRVSVTMEQLERILRKQGLSLQ